MAERIININKKETSVPLYNKDGSIVGFRSGRVTFQINSGGYATTISTDPPKFEEPARDIFGRVILAPVAEVDRAKWLNLLKERTPEENKAIRDMPLRKS